jgi:hypothetical protein
LEGGKWQPQQNDLQIQEKMNNSTSALNDFLRTNPIILISALFSTSYQEEQITMSLTTATDFEKLFWQLFNAHDEDALHEIVATYPLLTSESNWFPYGGSTIDDRSNFGTFENQQPAAIPALVEKITNSMDSILMKHCRLEGIDPKSPDAPRSMQEAVDRYFNIRNGDFSEVGDKKRREIAENIQIVATGDRQTPNLMIYDHGEGQLPDDFPNTFLSLHRNNKTDIHFVQGKYNMGSTGAVVFCGRNHRYQLIASKLDNALNHDRWEAKLGFTLVRRHPLTEEEETRFRSSWYEYLKIDGTIPSFPISEIAIGLDRGKPFLTGSIIKLYSYQLPRGSRSDVTFDLWRELNQFLYQPALPLLVVERRFGRTQNIDTKHESKTVLGNKTRIVIDDREKKEKTISLQIINAVMGQVDIEATAFKPDVERKEFINDKAVIFTVNGQVHGYLPRRFISEDLGLPMLRDTLLIQVDCTHIKTSFRQNLFMANRSNLKEGVELDELLDSLKQVVKSDDTLKQLNQDRRNRVFRDNQADEDILKSLLKSIPLDKDLINLLKKDGNLDFFKSTYRTEDIGSTLQKEEKPSPLISRRFPSIFRLDVKEDREGKRIKSIPLNGKGILNFETDVEDEYLFRPDEQGKLQIQVLGCTAPLKLDRKSALLN